MIDTGFPERRESAHPSPKTVLVVDDSSAMRKILKRILQESNLRVIEAANGQEALAYCAIDRPDLILLDIDMPVMDGLETLSAISVDPEFENIPVLMLTAHTSGPEVAKAIEIGAQDYLRKPCDPAELVARVRRTLSLKERQDILFKRAEELGEMSATDALTELGNRRFLAQRVGELTVELGDDAQVGLLMIDIDHFKGINDANGHLVGDAVLCELAQRLRLLVESPEAAVRWGGEEFLVLIPLPAEDSLAIRGEQIRNEMESRPFGIGSYGSIELTVSVGAAQGRLSELTVIIREADEALYQAKDGGRNKVEVSNRR